MPLVCPCWNVRVTTDGSETPLDAPPGAPTTVAGMEDVTLTWARLGMGGVHVEQSRLVSRKPAGTAGGWEAVTCLSCSTLCFVHMSASALAALTDTSHSTSGMSAASLVAVSSNLQAITAATTPPEGYSRMLGLALHPGKVARAGHAVAAEAFAAAGGGGGSSSAGAGSPRRKRSGSKRNLRVKTGSAGSVGVPGLLSDAQALLAEGHDGIVRFVRDEEAAMLHRIEEYTARQQEDFSRLVAQCRGELRVLASRISSLGLASEDGGSGGGGGATPPPVSAAPVPAQPASSPVAFRAASAGSRSPQAASARSPPAPPRPAPTVAATTTANAAAAAAGSSSTGVSPSRPPPHPPAHSAPYTRAQGKAHPIVADHKAFSRRRHRRRHHHSGGGGAAGGGRHRGRDRFSQPAMFSLDEELDPQLMQAWQRTRSRSLGSGPTSTAGDHTSGGTGTGAGAGSGSGSGSGGAGGASSDTASSSDFGSASGGTT